MKKCVLYNMMFSCGEWYPYGDSNPGLLRERQVSWSYLDDRGKVSSALEVPQYAAV